MVETESEGNLMVFLMAETKNEGCLKVLLAAKFSMFKAASGVAKNTGIMKPSLPPTFLLVILALC